MSTDLPEHDCVVNWIGSSGAMDIVATLDLVIKLCRYWEGRIYITALASDDDSTIRSYLCRISAGRNWKDTYEKQMSKETQVIVLRLCAPQFIE